jgi:CRISPR-associated endonuclease Cas1
MTTPASSNASREATVRNGVLTVSGYGVRVAVERGHLVVEDGVGTARRSLTFPRVGSGIRRVVVIGHSGTVSLEALRWLYELGASLVHLDADARVVTAGARAPINDAPLRRAQAGSIKTETGLAIARQLIALKIARQADVLGEVIDECEDACLTVRGAATSAAGAGSLDAVRLLEANAAAVYWRVLEDVPVHFTARDRKRTPAHWQRIGTRSSPLTNGPRSATTPAHALINYLYAIVEAETLRALSVVGCDPSFGVLHADAQSRHAFGYDVMEPIRPLADRYALRLIAEHTFTREDFFELRDGRCRILPALARPLAGTAPEWARAVAPIAEDVAHVFAEDAKRIRGALPRRWLGRHATSTDQTPTSEATLPRLRRTPLTGRNHAERRQRTPTDALGAPVPTPETLGVPRRCQRCGHELASRTHKYCLRCGVERRKELSERGLTSIKERRSRLSKSEDTRRRHARGEITRTFKREHRAWEAEHPGPHDVEWYATHVAPKLTRVRVRAIARAAGLSDSYAKEIRRGKVPHPRFWSALALLASEPSPGDLSPASRDARYYAKPIAPRLATVTPEAIRESTGLSLKYARQIQNGFYVPHPRHWRALELLIGFAHDTDEVASRRRSRDCNSPEGNDVAPLLASVYIRVTMRATVRL